MCSLAIATVALATAQPAASEKDLSSLAAAAVAQPRENAKMASLIYYFEIITTAFLRFGQILGPGESQSPSRSQQLSGAENFAQLRAVSTTSYTQEQKGMFGALSESTKEKKRVLFLSRSLTLHFVLAAIYKPRMNILSL